MALSDPSALITTDINDISYTAGQEPWNKNLDMLTIDIKETEANTYQVDWTKWHGVYRKIPEARSTLDVWCKWIVGKKLKMSPATKKIVDRFTGNGIDTFRTILINIKRVSKICGDCYAEAPRDKAKRLMNLKILDPGTIQVQANSMGIIKRYVQTTQKDATSDIGSKKSKILNKWKPKEIFHLANDRIADEIHGIPELEKTFDIMKWKYQGLADIATVFHRYVYPVLEIYAKTDDATELKEIEDIYTKSIKNMESRIIPAGSIEKVERVSIPQYSTLDPLPLQKFLRSYYTESSGVPDLIRGKSDEVSLAAGKLNYLGYKEKIIMEQIEFSEMLKSQLGLEVEFEEPVDIDIEIAREIGSLDDKNNAKKDKVIAEGKAND